MDRRLASIGTAFDILIEELDAGIQALNEAGARAFATGDYEEVDRCRQQAQRLMDLRKDVAALRQRWQAEKAVFAPEAPPASTTPVRRTRKAKRLPRGARTPEDAFRLPILQALVTFGGSAPVKDVLDFVGHLMKSQLNEIDYQPLPSDPRTPRWRNTVRWARQTMVDEGLLRSDSPRGIWEITEAGRQLVMSAGRTSPTDR